MDKKGDMNGVGRKPNPLINEKSPYLLQHAYNPVGWHPWGDEAFKKARLENKLIFLSIGYSTCHWCHVMERESFEDPEVAALMNDAFVSIKVDREERPDLDDFYMTVCQTMTGRGGWPLTIIMTPEARPFFAGTYIPKDAMFGRVGLLQMIPRVKAQWEKDPKRIEDIANRLSSLLVQSQERAASPAVLDRSVFYKAFKQLETLYDAQNGGFGVAPKFPTAHNLTFLLRYWKRTGDSKALAMVEKTLQAMRRGGIYDHLGFGFHRYSTDREWLVPHFEKMLYDQAMLAMAYTEAYQATGKDDYREVAGEVFEYVLRDMTGPEGGFYSAEDADSEGEEGRFYVWTEGEIRDTLSKRDAWLLMKVFNVEKGGNYAEEATGRKTGASILHMTGPLAEVAAEQGISFDDARTVIESARTRLFERRDRRVHPHKDDKVLTDWNGLMTAALARAAAAFDEPRYAEAAKKAADFIQEKITGPDGRLYHRYREGERAFPGYLDDYAFHVWGLIEIYEATFEVKYLKRALELNSRMLEHFLDEESGGFYFTSDETESLLVRRKGSYDAAMPSGNSIAMLNLIRLGRITADPALLQEADKVSRAFSTRILEAPAGYTQLLNALDFAFGPSSEVVIVGKPGSYDTRAMLREANKRFEPNKVLIFRPAGEESPDIVGIADYARPLEAVDGRATAYVCEDYSCKAPVTDPQKIFEKE